MAETGKTRFVMVTTFIVPAAFEEGFLIWWRMTAPMFSAQPGFLGAKLHRSLDSAARFRFINIAEWRTSPAERDALARIWSSTPKPSLPGFEWHPALYDVVEEI